MISLTHTRKWLPVVTLVALTACARGVAAQSPDRVSGKIIVMEAVRLTAQAVLAFRDSTDVWPISPRQFFQVADSAAYKNPVFRRDTLVVSFAFPGYEYEFAPFYVDSLKSFLHMPPAPSPNAQSFVPYEVYVASGRIWSLKQTADTLSVAGVHASLNVDRLK